MGSFADVRAAVESFLADSGRIVSTVGTAGVRGQQAHSLLAGQLQGSGRPDAWETLARWQGVDEAVRAALSELSVAAEQARAYLAACDSGDGRGSWLAPPTRHHGDGFNLRYEQWTRARSGAERGVEHPVDQEFKVERSGRAPVWFDSCGVIPDGRGDYTGILIDAKGRPPGRSRRTGHDASSVAESAGARGLLGWCGLVAGTGEELPVPATGLAIPVVVGSCCGTQVQRVGSGSGGWDAAPGPTG